jgi:hypothetical protein
VIGYWLMTHLSDRARLYVACALFDLSIIGCGITLFTSHEPPWILALSWGALTLTAADIIYSVIIIERQRKEAEKVNN